MNHQKEKTNQSAQRQCSTALTSITKSIKGYISNSIDKEKYNFAITESTKKIQSGSVVLNLRISLKDDTDKCRYLVFVLNRDAKTGMIHTFILDGDQYAPSVLFSTTDKYPVNKLERYVPSIIVSTQNMIK